MPRPGRRCPTLRGSPSVNAVNSRGTSLAPALHGIAIMRVRDIMSQQVVTITPSESCLDAVVRMQRARARHLPVVNREGALVGIVTDRDLRHHLFSRRAFEALGSTRVDVLLDEVHVAGIMSTDLVTATPEMSLIEVAAAMRAEKVGALPVLEQGRVVGIVTETDLLRHVVRVDATCAPECAEIIVAYP
jgi:CBS domain-containing protein